MVIYNTPHQIHGKFITVEQVKVHPLELKSEHWLPGTYLIKGDNYLMGEVPVLGKHKVYELNKPLTIN